MAGKGDGGCWERGGVRAGGRFHIYIPPSIFVPNLL